MLEGHWLLELTAQQDDEVAAPPFAEHRFSLRGFVDADGGPKCGCSKPEMNGLGIVGQPCGAFLSVLRGRE